MKKLLFVFAALLVFAQSAKTQTIYNNRSCPAQVSIRYLNSSCLDMGGTSVTVPAMSLPFPPIPVPPGVIELEIQVNAQPGSTPAPIIFVGVTRLCGGWPTSGSRSTTSCGTTNVNTTGGVGSCTINIF